MRVSDWVIDKNFSWYHSSSWSFRDAYFALVFHSCGKTISKRALCNPSVLLLSPSTKSASWRRDFWPIVFQSCACHSSQTVLATASILFYQFLTKCTTFQYAELAASPLFLCLKDTPTALVSNNLKDVSIEKYVLPITALFLAHVKLYCHNYYVQTQQKVSQL